MITQRILINHVEADEPVFQLGVRYKVITPTKEVIYFTTFQDALNWVEGMGVQEAQTTLF